MWKDIIEGARHVAKTAVWFSIGRESHFHYTSPSIYEYLELHIKNFGEYFWKVILIFGGCFWQVILISSMKKKTRKKVCVSEHGVEKRVQEMTHSGSSRLHPSNL